MLGDTGRAVGWQDGSVCVVCGASIRWVESRVVQDTSAVDRPFSYCEEWRVCEQGHEVLRLTRLDR
jgi:hypothetical protein